MACRPLYDALQGALDETLPTFSQDIRKASITHGASCALLNDNQCIEECETIYQTLDQCTACLSNAATCSDNIFSPDSVNGSACCPFAKEAMDCAICLDGTTGNCMEDAGLSTTSIIIISVSCGVVLTVVSILTYVLVKRSRKKSSKDDLLNNLSERGFNTSPIENVSFENVRQSSFDSLKNQS